MGAISISQTGGTISSISVKEVGAINELFQSYDNQTGQVFFNSINNGAPHDYIITFVGSKSGQVITQTFTLTCA